MALNSAENTTELVAEQVSSVLIQPLEAESQFLAAGPRIFDTAGPLRVPTMATSVGTAGWYGQNELIVEANPNFGEVSLLPSTMTAVKTLTRYSNELARQSVVNLDQALKDRLVKDVATAMDKQLFSAGGDGVYLPRGIFAYQGTQQVDLATSALDLDDLIDAQGLLLAAGASLTATKWVMRSDTFTKLRKVKGTDGNYIVQPDVTKGAGFQLLGSPVIVTNAIPAGKAAYVDFSQIIVARDVAPSVKFLDQTFGDYDQQAIRVVYRMDAAPANAGAIVVFDNIAV